MDTGTTPCGKTTGTGVNEPTVVTVSPPHVVTVPGRGRGLLPAAAWSGCIASEMLQAASKRPSPRTVVRFIIEFMFLFIVLLSFLRVFPSVLYVVYSRDRGLLICHLCSRWFAGY